MTVIYIYMWNISFQFALHKSLCDRARFYNRAIVSAWLDSVYDWWHNSLIAVSFIVRKICIKAEFTLYSKAMGEKVKGFFYKFSLINGLKTFNLKWNTAHGPGITERGGGKGQVKACTVMKGMQRDSSFHFSSFTKSLQFIEVFGKCAGLQNILKIILSTIKSKIFLIETLKLSVLCASIYAFFDTIIFRIIDTCKFYASHTQVVMWIMPFAYIKLILYTHCLKTRWYFRSVVPGEWLIRTT